MTENSQVNKPISFERWLIPLLIVAGLLLVAVFGLQVSRSFAKIRHAGFHPRAVNVDGIQGWMTVPGLARLFNVPEVYLYRQIGVPQQGGQHSSLSALNNRYFPGQPGMVVNRVKQAIRQFQVRNFPRPGGGG
jgi:hypothetical protein